MNPVSLIVAGLIAMTMAASQPPGWRPERAVAYRRVATLHAKMMVEKLQTRGQQLRKDGLPCLGAGDHLCLPCHALAPGTARSLSPIHITMMRGMRKGLTKKAPKDIRSVFCVDCHAYPLATEDLAKGGMKPKALADVQAGDMKFDINRKPCVQPGCHTDKKFKWAKTSLERMKQAVKHVPTDGLFRQGTTYDLLGYKFDGLVGRRTLKTAGAMTPWILIAVMLAAGYRLLQIASRSSSDDKPADGDSAASEEAEHE